MTGVPREMVSKVAIHKGHHSGREGKQGISSSSLQMLKDPSVNPFNCPKRYLVHLAQH